MAVELAGRTCDMGSVPQHPTTPLAFDLCVIIHRSIVFKPPI